MVCFLFLVFWFCFFFGQISGGRPRNQSTGMFISVGWSRWRGGAWHFVHLYMNIYIIQILSETRAGTWLSRSEQERWRRVALHFCICNYRYMNIYRYNRCIYSLVLFYMVYMVRSRAPSLIYSIYISTSTRSDRLFSIFRAEQIRRVQSQSINQSVASHCKWHRIIYSYRFVYIFIFFGCCCVFHFAFYAIRALCVAYFILYKQFVLCVVDLFVCLLFVRYLLQGAARFDISLRYKIDLILTWLQ